VGVDEEVEVDVGGGVIVGVSVTAVVCRYSQEMGGIR